MSARLHIEARGVDEMRHGVEALAAAYPRMGALACDQAMGLVVAQVRPKIPRRSGRTAASLSARSSAKGATIAADAPAFGWLDYGGRVGRKLATVRQFRPGGRYLYPGLQAKDQAIGAAMERLQDDAVRAAGLE